MAIATNWWGKPARVPFITYDGTPGDDFYTGTSGDDVLNGLGGRDQLTGGDGNDQLNGGDGDDLLNGGNGDDILNGDAGNDILIGGAGTDTMSGGSGNDLYLVDSLTDKVFEAAGGGSDTVYALTSYTLAAGQEIEELTASDNAGTQRLDLTGNEFDNRLYGNNGINLLSGGGGADLMAGFGGNDQYLVDNVGDRVIEALNGGYDIVFASVSYRLGAGQHIEELAANNSASTQRLDLTGNELDNQLTGNNGVNLLYGGGGADILSGLGGNDQYLVDGPNDDQVYEAVGQGYDVVFALSSYTLRAGQEIEELVVNNPAGTARLDLTGNEFVNRLYGSNGINLLDGRGGADVMTGYGGDDTYIVDNAGDSIVELAGGGYDRVEASLSYTLSAGVEVEEMAATGLTRIDLTGNELANALIGNSGVNVLYGGGGNDSLTGGGGADVFAFNTTFATAGVDTILDFVTGSDRIALDDSMFVGLAAVSASNFVIGIQAQDADDRIIYNNVTGALYFDADGNGAGAAIQFATLSNPLSVTPPSLAASDFVII